MKSKLKYYFTANKNEEIYVINHTHERYEMVLYASGCGTTKIGGKLYEYSPGSIAVIPPNVSHDETHKTQSDIICLNFEYPEKLNLCGVFNMDFSDIVAEIDNEIKNRQAYFEDFLNLYMDKIIFKILRFTQPNKELGDPFSYAMNYIKENYTQNINFCELANSLGYNADYFRHAFKKKFLISPKNQLIDYRVRQSKKLLIETDMSVSDISSSCGFSNSSQYSLFFKKSTGLKPSEYRKAKKSPSVPHGNSR